MRKYSYGLLLMGLLGAILACQKTGSATPGAPDPVDMRSSLVFSPSELPAAHVGQPYQATITVSKNKTPVFSMGIDSGDLPSGLTLSYQEGESTATIEGTPEKMGEFEFTLHAYCYGTNVSGQAAEQHYTLSVKQE
jgi:hypothetical protein